MRPYKPYITQRQARAAECAHWQEGYRRSRLIVMLWDAAQPRPAFLERLAFAQTLGKPIRLLCLDGTPVPEDLSAGYADVQAASVQTPEAGGAQIAAWLAALKEPTP